MIGTLDGLIVEALQERLASDENVLAVVDPDVRPNVLNHDLKSLVQSKSDESKLRLVIIGMDGSVAVVEVLMALELDDGEEEEEN